MNRENAVGPVAGRGAWLAAIPLLCLASCGGGGKQADAKKVARTEAPAAKTESEKGHGHEAEGTATCRTIDIGTHEFLGDLDFDPAAGSVVLTVNGHDSGKPHPHAKAKATLNVVLEKGTAQIEMTAEPQAGEPEGKTSRYKATDPALKGLKALKGRVNLTIDGKSYICDLEGGH